MYRRTFLVATAAGALALTQRAFANDPCIPNFKRSKKDVGTAVGGHLSGVISDVDGWEYNFEEDNKVLFEFVVSNPGPKRVSLAWCQPFTTGPWQILGSYPVDPGQNKTVVKGLRAENDSNFFFLEIASDGGGFVPVKGGTTFDCNANLNPQKTLSIMDWLKPQKVHVEIRARDTRS